MSTDELSTALWEDCDEMGQMGNGLIKEKHIDNHVCTLKLPEKIVFLMVIVLGMK